MIHRHLIAAAIVVGLMIVVAAQLTDPSAIVGQPLEPPSTQFLIGTDFLGRDVGARLLVGGVDTILFASLATVIAITAGILLTALTMPGPRRQATMMTAVLSALLSIPPILIAMVALVLTDAGRLQIAFSTGISMGAAVGVFLSSASRVITGAEFVTAAISLGGSEGHIWSRHIVPSLAPYLIQQAMVVFSYALIMNASLNVLGLGGAPGSPEWGSMLAEGRYSMRDAPWLVIAPGLALVVLVMAVNGFARVLERRLTTWR